MRDVFRIGGGIGLRCLLIVVCAWFVMSASAVASAGPTVSMTLVDADVRDVLTGLTAIGRVNVVIDDSVSGRISVDFKNIPFDTALDIVTRSKGLGMYRTGNIIVFASQEKMEKGFGQVKVFPLKYARADHIKNIIVGGGKSDSEFGVENPGTSTSGDAGSLKGSTGGATASSSNKEGIKGLVVNTDASTNSLIVFGSPDQIEKVELLLKELDVPYQQILLEAQILAMGKNFSKRLGIDWTWSTFPQPSSTSGSSTTTYFPAAIVKAGDGTNYTGGVIATLNAAISDGDAKLLARPNVMTFNGNKATIFMGEQLAVPKSTVSNGVVTYELGYKNVGIALSYVPRINESNQITASVFVEVSTPTSTTVTMGSTSISAYNVSTRSAQTNVRMNDGDTLVIGGLLSSTESKSLSKLPFLGDLPILGNLFRTLSKSKEEREVVIFLKAKILK